MSELKSERDHAREAEEAKESFDDQIEKQADTALDKIRAADVAGQLHQIGTSESTERVRASLKEAGEAINRKMDEQTHAFEEMVDEAETEEVDIEQRMLASEADAEELNRLSPFVRTKEAEAEIQNARKAARDAELFLDEIHRKREYERNQAEDQIDEIVEKTRATDVDTKQ